MLEASRKYFYFIWGQPKFHDENQFVFYKHYQNNFIGHLIEEAFIEVIAFFGITIVSIVAMFVSTAKTRKIIREMRSAIYVFCMVPLTTHAFHGFFSYLLTKEYTLYSWINIALTLAIYTIYWVQFFFLVRGTDHIKYLHEKGTYQEGKVKFEQGMDFSFDTYVNMDSKIWIRVTEFILYGAMALIWTMAYVFSSLAIVLIIAIHGFLIVFCLQKYKNFKLGSNERTKQKRILLMSVIHLILMAV
jgi:hypothetical protein